MTARIPSAVAPTFVEVVRRRVADQADCLAYTFLEDGESEAVSLSYTELDQRAQAIGAVLQEMGLAGERALLLYPPGLDYIAAFFGCLYAGVVAVPAYPPNPGRLERTLPRLTAMIHNARPAIALTTSAILPVGQAIGEQFPDFASLRWTATDAVPADASDAWQQPKISGDTLAFLQYTSGSTATPKGVMLTHANLLHNSALIQQAFAHTTSSQGVIWLPPYHDMGLIGGILQPLYVGFPVTLMSPVSMLQRPVRWLQAITRYKATTSGGPNFAYDLCVRKTTAEQRAELDLSSWTVAFNGAEPIRAETLERFTAAFAQCGFRKEAFYPCYGLAEATLIVTGGRAADPPTVREFDQAALERNEVAAADGRALVSSGQPLPDQQVAIVDPETLARCAPDRVGEIWVAGPSVAQGYWQQPEQTSQTFRATLDSAQSPTFLRTGDLGFLHEGELFVTGRLKDLMIIRGRNYYPHDIELIVERSQPIFRPGGSAAFTVEVSGEERLVVMQELERQARQVDLDTVAAAIRQSVAEAHELQVYAVVLLKPGSIPKTSSGKIQRYACRKSFLEGTIEPLGSSILDASAASSGQIDLSREALLSSLAEDREQLVMTYLLARLARVLRADASRISAHEPITALGLDSLAAIELQHSVEADLGLIVSIEQLLQGWSAAQLAAEILRQIDEPDAAQAIQRVSSQESTALHPLSPGQRALWFLYQVAPANAAYNIASAARIQGKLDVAALRRAFQALVERHPMLRATFTAPHADPIQRIQPRAEIAFQVEDGSGWSAEQLDDYLIREAQRPFHLERGPLLRVHLVPRSADEHIFLLVVHHIVTDLWSLTILVRELAMLYPAEASNRPVQLPAPGLDYTDYARWQTTRLTGPDGEKLWQYWQQALMGAPDILDLPTDRPRPSIQTNRGASHAFKLRPELTQQIKSLAQSAEVTLFVTLLAAFDVLLYRYTGQSDILIGAPTTGRTRAEFAETVGYFVNPVVLRSQLSSGLPFMTLLRQVRQTVLEALAHQDFPFAHIVERLQPERDFSRSPLFQVMFALQKAHQLDAEGLSIFALGEPGAQIRLGQLPVESIALEQRLVQFDLVLLMAEGSAGLAGSLQYNTDLFDRQTIERLAAHLQAVLEAVVADPWQPVDRLPLLGQAELQQILVDWNATAMTYPENRCIHQLFEEQAARTPDAIAVTYGRETTTYADLNRRANQLAHYLQALGVGPEVCVAFCVEPSFEMVVMLLGILKAGGAYLALDPSYPPARLQFMLDDSGVQVLLTQQPVLDRVPLQAPQIVCLDREEPQIARQPAHNPESGVMPENLAYLIYTSGSSGIPKGALLPHRGAVNNLWWRQTTWPLTADDRMLHVFSVSFDPSVWNIFWPLIAGAQLVLVSPDERADSVALVRLLSEHRITAFGAVPTLHTLLLEQPEIANCASVRYVVSGGESLSAELQQRFFERLDAILCNCYGPTEATIDTTFWVCSRDGKPRAAPIGRPLPNVQVYLLDAQMQPVPVGVPGELYIGGDGLARGYLNRGDATAAAFIPNPFSETPGTRLYKTGDLARYLPDGALEFGGRIDHQVKVRGFRIELGEIEAALRQHEAIRDAAVLVRDERLVAYVVENTEHSTASRDAGDDCSVFSVHGSSQELRQHLGSRLPDYMIPSAFVRLDALPLTTNGKVDRNALPDPALATSERIVVSPRTPTEERLVQIWSQVLDVAPIGVEDNFFALGGHSLLAVQVMYQIREKLQVDVPLHTILESATIAELAAVIDRQQAAQQAPKRPQIQARPRGNKSVDQLIAKLDQLTDR